MSVGACDARDDMAPVRATATALAVAADLAERWAIPGAMWTRDGDHCMTGAQLGALFATAREVVASAG